MKQFEPLISDTEDPVFITAVESREILLLNRAALEQCRNHDITGAIFDEIVFVDTNLASSTSAYFCGRWFDIDEKTFTHDDAEYVRIVLRNRYNVPDGETLKSLKSMVAVLIHRLRSPLTGMQGYLELMEEDLSGKKDTRRFNSVQDGIDHLFDILDEVEKFYSIPVGRIDSAEKSSANPLSVIESVAADLHLNKKIVLKNTANRQSPEFRCEPAILRKIVTILLQNAAEQLYPQDGNIKVEIHSDSMLTIQQPGKPIPAEIADRLFQPFVTSKANSLGLGLTMAHLYADQISAGIFLSENGESGNITFTLCLPPLSD